MVQQDSEDTESIHYSSSACDFHPITVTYKNNYIHSSSIKNLVIEETSKLNCLNINIMTKVCIKLKNIQVKDAWRVKLITGRHLLFARRGLTLKIDKI